MLRVEQATRQRFALLGGVVAIFLGGLLISGFIERLSGSMEDRRVSPADLAKARQEQERAREIRSEAGALAHDGRWKDVVSFLDRTSVENGSLPFLRAEAALRAGRLEEAKKGFLAFMPSEDPVSYATRLVLQDNTPEYQRFCEKTINDQSKRDPTSTEANNTAWLCVLAPGALKDYGPAIDLAKIGVVTAAEEDRSNFLNTLGAVHYRAGNWQDAIDVLLQAEKIREEPFNWPFLALSYHALGNEAEAQRYYARLRDHLNGTFAKPTGPFGGQNRHELLLFFHETEAALGGSASTSKASL